MKILTEKSIKECDKKAFQIIKSQVLRKPDSLIGLAVGKTTDGLHKLISMDVKKNPYAWKKIKLFQIDENLGLSPQSPHSFNSEIRKELKNLFRIINPKNIFLIDGTKDPKITIQEASKFIKKNDGIDLIVLGIGPEYDPHIAYNTTGKSSLNSGMRVVKLHPKIAEKILTIKQETRSGEQEAGNRKHEARSRKIMLHASCLSSLQGITLGIKDILKTKKALLIAFGKDKTKSVSLAFNSNNKKKVNMKKASASALLLHKDLTVILDKNAAKSL